jgi:hypothetical protein
MNTRALFLSALIAGLVTGVLGSLPLLNLVNCFLCLWVWLGGALAVWLYRRYRPGDPGLSPAQGAGLGAAAGLIGALTGFLVFLVTGAISAPLIERLMRLVEMEDAIPVRTGSGGIIVQALIFLAIDLVLYPLFGALAGLIAANVMFKNRPQNVLPS